MFSATSRRRSPSTLKRRSMSSRRRLTWSSVRSRTRVSGLMFVWVRIFWAVGRPIPKMYVSETSTRFSRGMSTPAIRATGLLPLPLLVLRVGADDHHGPVAANHFAVVAAGLDGGSDFQRILIARLVPKDSLITSADR